MEFDVHCISLARAKEHRQPFIDRWRMILGERLRVFEAVDALDLPEGVVFKRNPCIGIATRPAYACLMSHLTVMRQCLAEGVGYEGVAIMEDDADPVEGVNVWEAVAEARAEVPQLDMLVLTPSIMGGWGERRTPSVAFPSRAQEVPAPGTHFIWYSERGLQRYVDTFKSMPAMSDAFHLFPNDGSMGRLWKPVAVHGDAPSTIGYIHPPRPWNK